MVRNSDPNLIRRQHTFSVDSSLKLVPDIAVSRHLFLGFYFIEPEIIPPCKARIYRFDKNDKAIIFSRLVILQYNRLQSLKQPVVTTFNFRAIPKT